MKKDVSKNFNFKLVYLNVVKCKQLTLNNNIESIHYNE